MAELAFPSGFLWGAATAAHQVAIDHYHRFRDDIALLAGVGLNTYRFSVEWARIEPADGVFDEAALDHYRAVVDAVRGAGLTPMVTLHHFTLPRWVAAQGGWMAQRTPARFARYAGRVVRALADSVDWYCTINEPGVVAWGGYFGALDFPPGRTDTRSWEQAIAGLAAGHRLGYEAVKSARPSARAGLTNQLIEWEPDEGARSAGGPRTCSSRPHEATTSSASRPTRARWSGCGRGSRRRSGSRSGAGSFATA